MESTLQKPVLGAAETAAKVKTIVCWIVTALFCLQMSFTAYAQLRLPQVTEAFTHLGFPAVQNAPGHSRCFVHFSPGSLHTLVIGTICNCVSDKAMHRPEKR